jgi:hypothetical protein
MAFCSSIPKFLPLKRRGRQACLEVLGTLLPGNIIEEPLMMRVKLMGIQVNDLARAFYTDMIGFRIKRDATFGESAWLTLVACIARGCPSRLGARWGHAPMPEIQ